MKRLASERGKKVRSRPGGGGKSVENGEKILNRGNKARNLLTIKDLVFSGPQNKLPFKASKAPSNPRRCPTIDELWSLE
jgi:hypothetical protein